MEFTTEELEQLTALVEKAKEVEVMSEKEALISHINNILTLENSNFKCEYVVEADTENANVYKYGTQVYSLNLTNKPSYSIMREIMMVTHNLEDHHMSPTYDGINDAMALIVEKVVEEKGNAEAYKWFKEMNIDDDILDEYDLHKPRKYDVVNFHITVTKEFRGMVAVPHDYEDWQIEDYIKENVLEAIDDDDYEDKDDADVNIGSIEYHNVDADSTELEECVNEDNLEYDFDDDCFN